MGNSEAAVILTAGYLNLNRNFQTCTAPLESQEHGIQAYSRALILLITEVVVAVIEATIIQSFHNASSCVSCKAVRIPVVLSGTAVYTYAEILTDKRCDKLQKYAVIFM